MPHRVQFKKKRRERRRGFAEQLIIFRSVHGGGVDGPVVEAIQMKCEVDPTQEEPWNLWQQLQADMERHEFQVTDVKPGVFYSEKGHHTDAALPRNIRQTIEEHFCR